MSAIKQWWQGADVADKVTPMRPNQDHIVTQPAHRTQPPPQPDPRFHLPRQMIDEDNAARRIWFALMELENDEARKRVMSMVSHNVSLYTSLGQEPPEGHPV